MIALATISLSQALGVWGDLVEAYHGVNGYGGDTAEVYLFRLMPRDPSAERGPDGGTLAAQAVVAQARAARLALADLCRLFAEHYGDAIVTIEGLSIDAWPGADEHNRHRAHVHVGRVPR